MELAMGFGLLVLGAICGGSFGLPSKFAGKDTPWEVLWGPFFFFATILIPTVFGPWIVKDMGAVYGSVTTNAIVMTLIFGFLWGLGSMTLGMSFAFIGLSLAYALNYGAQIMFGSMMPMALFRSDQILTPHGYVIMAGVAVCLVGVVIAGRAGILKDQSSGEEEEKEDAGAIAKPNITIGLVIGVVSGILCACYAVAAGYADAGGIGGNAVTQFGNENWQAACAITALILWGGAISSLTYCVWQLTANKTWGRLAGPGIGRILMLAAVMALLHDLAIFFFGLGFIKLGPLGISVGYAAFMAFAIIVGNIHGFRTGEWKGASRESVTWIAAGIAILVIGVCILATGNAMERKAGEQAKEAAKAKETAFVTTAERAEFREFQ